MRYKGSMHQNYAHEYRVKSSLSKRTDLYKKKSRNKTCVFLIIALSYFSPLLKSRIHTSPRFIPTSWSMKQKPKNLEHQVHFHIEGTFDQSKPIIVRLSAYDAQKSNTSFKQFFSALYMYIQN